MNKLTMILRHNSLLIIVLASIFLWGKDVFAGKEIFETSFSTSKSVPLDVTFVGRQKNKTTLRNFKGNIVILNFWATWCEPCVREMPALRNLANKYKGRDFEVLAISQDFRGFTSIDPFLVRYGLEDIQVYWDRGNRLFRAFSASALPTTIIIDKEGKEITRVAGFVDWESDDIHTFIETLLQN